MGILGGGPAGLSLALLLERGSEVLEMDRHPGGHAASFEIDGFTFDYGPHIMFSKNQAILDFMVRSLGDNVHRCRRNNKIIFKNRLLKYPFENDLKSLPLEDNYECVRDFIFNPYKTSLAAPANLKEWLLAKFGQGICSRYLFPYNEKVWNIPVEELSMIWAERIPDPKPEDVLKSSIGFETEGYVHQLYYYYPKSGGYQAISESWARRANVIYGFDVQRVQKSRDGFQVSSATETRNYKSLASSLPVQELVKILAMDIPLEVRQAVDKLIINPMYIISLGIKGSDDNKFTAVYFPESEFLVNRISYPGTFSPQNCPEGTHSIQAEITTRAGSEVWRMTDGEILEHVVSGLLQRGLIRSRESILVADVCRKRYSYVVYDINFERNVRLVRDWFSAQGIHLIGRFGYVEYVNVDGILHRCMEVASQIERNGVSLAWDEVRFGA
jgi:protoporphyrinogen oxidase